MGKEHKGIYRARDIFGFSFLFLSFNLGQLQSNRLRKVIGNSGYGKRIILLNFILIRIVNVNLEGTALLLLGRILRTHANCLPCD